MAKGRKSQYVWVFDPKSRPGTKPTDRLKKEVSDLAEPILAEWRERYVKPPRNPSLNYLTTVYTRWRGNYFSFCGTYACPHPDAISPTFDICFARLEYLGQLGFNLAYFRHTGRWWQTRKAISLDAALEEIKRNSIYHPF
jgi:hypothetical protein